MDTVRAFGYELRCVVPMVVLSGLTRVPAAFAVRAADTGVPKRASVWSAGIYHEQQEGMMCAMHAINNLLQDKRYDEFQLAEIGRDLDKWEKAASGAMQGDGGSSNNVRADGYFGIQVISMALQKLNLAMTPLGSDQAVAARANPAACDGFIVNHGDHWFAIRRIGDAWFDLNSTQAKPKYISSTYVDMFLTQLQQAGQSVFVVAGKYPYCKLASDPEQLRRAVEAHTDRADARTWGSAGGGQTTGRSAAFSGAGHSLRGGGSGRGGGSDFGAGEDADLAAAIAASLSEAGGSGAGVAATGAAVAGAVGGFADNGMDADLAAAIAASMADAQPAAASLQEGRSEAAAPSGGGVPNAEELRRRRMARFG